MFGLGFLKDLLELRKLVYRCDICGRRRLRSEGAPVVVKLGTHYFDRISATIYGTYCPICSKRIAEKWKEMNAGGEESSDAPEPPGEVIRCEPLRKGADPEDEVTANEPLASEAVVITEGELHASARLAEKERAEKAAEIYAAAYEDPVQYGALASCISIKGHVAAAHKELLKRRGIVADPRPCVDHLFVSVRHRTGRLLTDTEKDVLAERIGVEMASMDAEGRVTR